MDYYTAIWMALTVPLVTMVIMLKAPETPAYLIKVGKFEVSVINLQLYLKRERERDFQRNVKNRHEMDRISIRSYTSIVLY